MKRLIANRPEWKRIIQKRFYCSTVNSLDYKGYITLLCMDTVKEPLWIKSSGNSICIVDDGYSWLQHFPQDKHFSVTTMFDAGGKVIQWYIDIILRQGITENNIPWLDDLFLDIVVTPSGEAVLLDADELEAALKIGEISKFEYDLAWRESKKLLTQISQNNFGLFRLCENHRQSLLRSTEIL